MNTLRIPLLCAVGSSRGIAIRYLDLSVNDALLMRLARLRLLCTTQNLEACQITVSARADGGRPVSMTLTLCRNGTFTLSQGQGVRSKSLPFSALWGDNPSQQDSRLISEDISCGAHP